jgi:putative phosphoribosyl transferase
LARRHGHTLDSVFLFDDRRHAGAVLARDLARVAQDDAVVVGLARGGVVVAAVAARALGLPLDAVAVRKIRHPGQPEYALGAVAPGGIAMIRDSEALTEQQLLVAIARARAEAADLDERLHHDHAAVPLTGRAVILVDDGLATGATMRAAAHWAASCGARRVVAAAPVGARETVSRLAEEVDAVVCPYPVDDLVAVGLWYEDFGQVDDDEVAALLAASSAFAPAR